MAITTTDIRCAGVPAYFAIPERVGTAGAVLVLPSIHGREAYVMRFVHDLAEAGFPTLLWDLFHGQGEAHTRDERHARGASLTDAGSLAQMSCCLDSLFTTFGCANVVALGFCLGGRYGLLLAEHDRRLSGLVPFYPTIETPRLPSQEVDVVARAGDIACPVHLMVPGNDHLTSRATFEALQASLQSRRQPTSIQYFPEAEHAFLQVDRRLGAANAQAVALAKASALAFLDATLRAGPPSRN